MLKLLFGSDLRVKLLNDFLLFERKPKNIAEISKELKLTTTPVFKEIDNLISLGFIKEVKAPDQDSSLKRTPNPNNPKPLNKNKTKLSKKSDERYFIADENFVLYDEIKALLAKAQLLSTRSFFNDLKKNFSLKLVIITGFFINNPDAPTDLLIIGSIKRPIFLKMLNDLERKIGREINFTIMDEAEFIYRQEIMDIFLYKILNGKKITLLNFLAAK